MSPDDLTLFAQGMLHLGILYEKNITQTLIEIYWQALKPFPLDAIQAAFQRHIHDSERGQFMPKPADVLRYLTKTSAVQAVDAWQKVLRAMREVGAYRSLVFDDPLIHIIIPEFGGWVALCRLEEKVLPFCAREFERRYVAFTLQPPAEHPPKLMGIIEQANHVAGFENPPPVFIGEPAKAQAVYLKGRVPQKIAHPFFLECTLAES